MLKELGIDEELEKLSKQVEKEIQNQFEKMEEISQKNSLKVLGAFQDCNLQESHLNSSTGYGIDESGRNKIEEIYAKVFKAEDSLVRAQLISGTHALAITLSAILRPNDTMISITGAPYDTLQTVIGCVENPSPSSLKSYGIKYEQIELIENDFDVQSIQGRLEKQDVKLVEIQRSRGYSTRKSLSIEKIEKIIKKIREINKNVIIMVDNCYGEFVQDREPIEVGADIAVGSLMKNLGAGIATSGGYVVGRKDLINSVAERLTAPCVGKDLGANFNQLLSYYKGLFMSPSVVKSTLKTMIFASRMLEKFGFGEVSPKYDEERTDIIQTMDLLTEENLIKFCQGVQMGSPVEAYVKPIPDEMPGYPHKEIMAGGTFTPGATIELSCDGPLVEPYTAYMQGGLTYEYGKLGIMIAIENMLK